MSQPAIQTTLGALVDSEAALLKVLAVKFDKDGGAKLRYHVVKLAKLVAAETKHFYDERNALIERFGDGEPKSLQRTSPNWAAFSAELKPLTEVPISIPWGPLTSAHVEPYPEIVGAELLALGPLYELDPEKEGDQK